MINAVIVSTAFCQIGRAYPGAFNNQPSPTFVAHAMDAVMARAGTS